MNAGDEESSETNENAAARASTPAPSSSPTSNAQYSGSAHSGSVHTGNSNAPEARERGSIPPEDGEAPARRRLERVLPEIIKKALEKGLEAGLGTLSNTNDAIRGVVGKAELPKEVAGYVFSQIDETKNAVVRVVAREVREFLEATDLSSELQRLLTSLSFEVRTEIRFIPNDSGGIKPDVKARVGPKLNKKPPSKGKREDEKDDESTD